MSKNRKTVNLALQGGGAHGAFTWGVLDKLLEDGRLDIEAISGTSAGAMNAVAVADGLMRDGNDGARTALEQFWRSISERSAFSPIQRLPFDVLMGNWSLDHTPSYHFFDAMTRIASPYQFNPLNINPLLQLLEECIDFDRVRSCDILKLFISAIDVETGRVKIFDRSKLTAEMVMASARLPFLFQAVEIDGVPYWDGGYMGNPSLFPFHTHSESGDIVVVQINPIERRGAPRTAQEILNRINEISFNGSLLREFRAIDFVRRLIEDGKLSQKHYRKTRVHVIENQEELKPLGASSKVNAEWRFLVHLRNIGRQTAEQWLADNINDVGKRSTVDLRAMFQGLGAEHHG